MRLEIPEHLLVAYKDGLATVQHESEIEQAVVGTTAALYKTPTDAAVALQRQQAIIGQAASILQSQITVFYQSQASRSGAAVANAARTDAENLAARTFPERIGGGRGGAGAGGRWGRTWRSGWQVRLRI